MSNKNKKNRHIHPQPVDPETKAKQEEELDRHIERTTISVDSTVFKLLSRTATRNKVDKGVLTDLAIRAMLGSLFSYGYHPMEMDIGDIKPTKGFIEGPTIFLTEYAVNALEHIAVLFGVRMCDVLRDAILAQRFNWQRMQPVNARSMSSIRLQMFEQEQLGPR